VTDHSSRTTHHVLRITHHVLRFTHHAFKARCTWLDAKEAPMICPNCKRDVPDTAKACGYCGHWLAAEDARPTVEAPDESGATVALPEEKGRSPWLWIGVGLGVVALVVALGVVAFLVGREGEDTAAGVSTQAEDVYDDFDDPAFDGDYDESRWRPTDDSPGDSVQEGGFLVVSQESEADSATRMVARDYDFVRLDGPTTFEADLKLDPDRSAGYVYLALEAEVPDGDEWWWTDCSLSEDWLGCYADLGYQPEGISVEPGTWHTVRIDVDPATMTFTYYVDGRIEGTFVPSNAEALKDADLALQLGVWHDERENGVVGFIDEVRIGPIE
jgi:hypothetical protein